MSKEKQEFVVVIPVEPVAKARPRAGKSGFYTPTKTANFERVAKSYMFKQHLDKPLSGAIGVHINFILPKPKRPKDTHPIARPDLDNYMKAIFDAGNGVLWADDAQIVICSAAKMYESDTLKVGVTVGAWRVGQ